MYATESKDVSDCAVNEADDCKLRLYDVWQCQINALTQNKNLF